MKKQYLLTILIWMFIDQSNQFICPSIEVQNHVSLLADYVDCTVILGYVKISIVSASLEAWHNYSMPGVTEITDQLILYRVDGLDSVETLFPNLVMIRGSHAVHDYSLVLFENLDLEEVGLRALKFILRGHVRIEKNPSLCFAKSIDWDKITGTTNGTANVIQDNSPTCPDVEEVCSNCTRNECWGPGECVEYYDPAVDDAGCHELCLGGCFVTNDSRQCKACKTFNHYGECFDVCPNNTLDYDGFFCMEILECERRFNRFIRNGRCLEACTEKHKWGDIGVCYNCPDGPCESRCNGNKILDSIQPIQDLRRCTVINGSLTIRLIHNPQAIKELYEALKDVQVIVGFLAIHRNRFSSLYFFKSLVEIQGHYLDGHNAAFKVMDNPNIVTLFDWKIRDHIKLDGYLSIHNNKRLCLSEIRKLIRASNREDIRLPDHEVSRNTNGVENCTFVELNTTYKMISSKSVLIRWQPYTPPSKSHVLHAYGVYYAESKDVNVEDVFRATEECQGASWNETTFPVHDLPDGDDSRYKILLKNLKPYTNYSYYVASILTEKMSYEGPLEDVGAQSRLHHFRTLTHQPSRPLKLKARNISPAEIKLTWEPPGRPNGELTKYIIVAYLQLSELRQINQRNYCLAPKRMYGMHNNDLNPEALCLPEDDPVLLSLGISSDETHIYDSRMEMLIEKILMEPFENIDPDNISDVVIPKMKTVRDVSEDIIKLTTGEYVVYNATIHSSKTEHVMSDLLHYGKYKITMSACNVEYCSEVTMLTQRTAASPFVDDIVHFNATAEDNQIILYWTEPERPNAIILLYKVQIREKPDDPNIYYDPNIMPDEICITRDEHRKNNYMYKIPNLPGKVYTARVRAESLHGPGSWTENISVQLYEHSYMRIYLIICGVAFSSIGAFVGISTFLYRRRLRKEGRRHLLATVDRRKMRQHAKKFDLKTNLSPIPDMGVFAGKYSRKTCLLKLSKIQGIVHPKYKEQFFENVEEFKNCNTEFIIKIYGSISSGLPYIVILDSAEFVLSHYLSECAINNTTLPPRAMFKWAAEIADALAYLTKRNFIHGDIAARNVMLTTELTAKLSNFGLGKGLEPDCYKTIHNRRVVPLRWTAREVLVKNKGFSQQTEAWSYGVLLWEIANCGRLSKPYHDVTDNNVVMHLMRGRSLEPPQNMPRILAKLMTLCFGQSGERPNFKDIVFLGISTDDNFHYLSFVFSDNRGNNSAHLDVSRSTVRYNVDADDEPLIENEEAVRVSIPVPVPESNYYEDTIDTQRNRLNRLFDITPEDWVEWGRSKLETVRARIGQSPPP